MIFKLSDTILRTLYKIFLSLRFYKKRLPVSPFSVLKNLEESQYYDRLTIEKFQLQKINSLVKEAKGSVPYYGKAINGSCFNFNSLEHFNNSFKILFKSDILKHREIITNKDKGKGYIHTTSGSTGEPLIVKISGLAESYRFAAKMRFYNWWGVNFYDKSVLIWNVKEKDDNYASLIENLKTRLKNRLDVNVFNLNDNTIYSYVEKINNFDAKYIRGYKSGLYDLACLMDKHNLHLKEGSIKVIIVTSEVLLESERTFMEAVFKCRVANEYGSAESGFYAAECEKGSMHINEEIVYIRTDEYNNAYVTELYNDKMPFINYKNEDQLILSDEFCSCGKTSRIIKEIKGRTSDFVTCQDGTVKSALIFPVIVRDAIKRSFKKSIEQYRFVQDSDGFVLELIKGPDFDQDVSSAIKKGFHKEIGKDVSFNIKFVDSIERDPSGKKRFFIKKRTQKSLKEK